MKVLIVLYTLIGLALSTTLLDQCDNNKCDFDRNSGSVMFKSKHNVSKMANTTSNIKDMHFMSVADENIGTDTNDEEAGMDIFCN